MLKPNAVDDLGNSVVKALVRLAFVSALVASAPHLVRAQATSSAPNSPASTWQGIDILFTPYVWFPWTSFGVRPADTRIPSVSNTIGPGHLYDQLTWFPFMGETEFRHDQYGIVLDYIHAPLKAGVSTRDILFSGGTGGLTIDTGTAMFLYRAIAQPNQYVDVGMGVRGWGLAGDISLNQGLLPPVSVSSGLAWADPLFAVRYHRELGNGFGATIYADVGGFGLGAHVDWQAVGTIDYAWKSNVDVHAGFRSLNFNYGAPHADFNVNMYGPIIAATFKF